MDRTLVIEHRIAQLLKLPVWLFSGSFIIGTLLLLINILSDGEIKELSFVFGLLYLLIAGFSNASVFAALVICSYIFKEYQSKILQQACKLLVNIPIVILYAYLVFNNPFL